MATRAAADYPTPATVVVVVEGVHTHVVAGGLVIAKRPVRRAMAVAVITNCAAGARVAARAAVLGIGIRIDALAAAARLTGWAGVAARAAVAWVGLGVDALVVAAGVGWPA